MKIETGVMVMKNGKAWGITHEDGRSISYGWMHPEDAPIHNPEFCKKPEDVTYKESPYVSELRSAKLVRVKRTTSVLIED